jgi:hypothetical protein
MGGMGRMRCALVSVLGLLSGIVFGFAFNTNVANYWILFALFSALTLIAVIISAKQEVEQEDKLGELENNLEIAIKILCDLARNTKE